MTPELTDAVVAAYQAKYGEPLGVKLEAVAAAVLTGLLTPSSVPPDSEIAFVALQTMVRNFARDHAIALKE